MTREEAIKKIKALFTEERLQKFAHNNVNYDGEIDDDLRSDFLSTFKDEIEQIADMVVTEEKKELFNKLKNDEV